eukprot:scaffold5013_cov273-Pinguiococcus_pyrenoidosus.AAC.5
MARKASRARARSRTEVYKLQGNAYMYPEFPILLRLWIETAPRALQLKRLCERVVEVRAILRALVRGVPILMLRRRHARHRAPRRSDLDADRDILAGELARWVQGARGTDLDNAG